MNNFFLTTKLLVISAFSISIFSTLILGNVTARANYGDFGAGSLPSFPSSSSSPSFNSSSNSQNSQNSSNSNNSSSSKNNSNIGKLELLIEDPYVCGGGTFGSVKGGTGKKIVTVEIFNGSELVYTVSTVADSSGKWKVNFDYSKIPNGRYTIKSTAKDESGLSAEYKLDADIKTKADCSGVVVLSNQINAILVRTGGFVQNNLPMTLMSAISLLGFVIFFKTFGKKKSIYR